jgi:hypothetical protein
VRQYRLRSVYDFYEAVVLQVKVAYSPLSNVPEPPGPLTSRHISPTRLQRSVAITIKARFLWRINIVRNLKVFGTANSDTLAS